MAKRVKKQPNSLSREEELELCKTPDPNDTIAEIAARIAADSGRDFDEVVQELIYESMT